MFDPIANTNTLVVLLWVKFGVIAKVILHDLIVHIALYNNLAHASKM
jgi:hypothetical protein